MAKTDTPRVAVMPLYKEQHKEPPVYIQQPKSKGPYEKANNFSMAVIQGNTRFLCLMALLLISTTLLSSQASGRNIGKISSSFVYHFQEKFVVSGCYILSLSHESLGINYKEIYVFQELAVVVLYVFVISSVSDLEIV
jgi:hypothetical protein